MFMTYFPQKFILVHCTHGFNRTGLCSQCRQLHRPGYANKKCTLLLCWDGALMAASTSRTSLSFSQACLPFYRPSRIPFQSTSIC